MFNTQNFNTKNINDNTINIKSGSNIVLQKSHPRSFFEKFHVNSKMAKWVFDSDPCLKKQIVRYGDVVYEPYMKIVVLQVLYLANDELLCELVNKEDFENNK